MITLNVKQLKELGACEEGVAWFKKKRVKSLNKIVSLLLKEKHFGWVRWLLPRLMTRPQKVRLAIYSAELVLEVFEKKCPGDDRPRKAIQAAKDFLVGKIDANAAYSAAYSAYSAANAANAANAAYAAANAAYAANAAANAGAYAAYAAYAAANAANAAYAAANTAYAAAYAANAAANAANAANAASMKKIAEYGLKLLGANSK